MKEVDVFGVYVAPMAAYIFYAFIVFARERKGLDRIEVQKWVWHRPLFDTAVFVIILSVIGLIF